MKNKFAFTLAEVLITLVIIGVVAALTIPTAISKYRKTTVETRLKNSYSTLANAVKMSTIDNGDISGWDYNAGSWDEFLKKYIYPYVRNSKMRCYTRGNTPYCDIALSNGTIWILRQHPNSPTAENFWMTVTMDINGDAKPNLLGYDRFTFHIFRKAANNYNFGDGDLAHNVPSQGIYYDGYGIANNTLKNSQYRGCNADCVPAGGYGIVCKSYCTALIVKNNWRIPDDYPVNF